MMRTVLLLEDDEQVRELLLMQLTRAGWNVLPAARLADAEAMLSNGLRPDIGVIDLHLPNGSGLDVLRRLVGIDGTWPIVVCSGIVSDEWSNEIVRLHWRIQSFLPKDRIQGNVLAVMLDHALIRANREQQRFERMAYLERDRDQKAELLATLQAEAQAARDAANSVASSARAIRRRRSLGAAGVLLSVGGILMKWPSWAELSKPWVIGLALIASAAALIARAKSDDAGK
jgi:DNA-binding NtrC family response regulator